MFSEQFCLNAREKMILEEIFIFTGIIYMQVWFTAPLALSVPNNDFQLIKELVQYNEPNIVMVTVKKMLGHL